MNAMLIIEEHLRRMYAQMSVEQLEEVIWDFSHLEALAMRLHHDRLSASLHGSDTELCTETSNHFLMGNGSSFMPETVRKKISGIH